MDEVATILDIGVKEDRGPPRNNAKEGSGR